MNNRIKELRKTLGLTQQEFGEKIKVKRNTIATYEMGRSEPSDSAISLICVTFNVNEDWLRTGTGEMFNNQDRNKEIANTIRNFLSNEKDSFKERLISVLIRLNESDWEVLEKIVIDLVENKVSNSKTKSELLVTKERVMPQKKSVELPSEFIGKSIEELDRYADLLEDLIEKKEISLNLEELEDKKEDLI